MWKLKTAAAIATAFIMSVAGTAWYAWSKGKGEGRAEVQQMWDKEVAQMAQAQAEELMKARQREQALQALVDRQRRAHREEVNRIAAEYAADLERLRERPEARADSPSGLPEGAVSGVGCTGAGLAMGDAAFLAGYAADAARLQSALNACVAHVTEVERQLNR